MNVIIIIFYIQLQFSYMKLKCEVQQLSYHINIHFLDIKYQIKKNSIS